jgi:phosphotransferase system HPr-like phosphotransfer protein
MKVISTSLAIVCLLSSSAIAIQLSQRDADEDKALAAIQEAINSEATDETGGEEAVDAT